MSKKNAKFFKQLPVLKMLYFNTITRHNLSFLTKMRGLTTLFDKQLRIYEISKKIIFTKKYAILVTSRVRKSGPK